MKPTYEIQSELASSNWSAVGLCGAEGRGLTIGQQSPHKTERGAFSFVSLYTLDCLPNSNKEYTQGFLALYLPLIGTGHDGRHGSILKRRRTTELSREKKKDRRAFEKKYKIRTYRRTPSFFCLCLCLSIREDSPQLTGEWQASQEGSACMYILAQPCTFSLASRQRGQR